MSCKRDDLLLRGIRSDVCSNLEFYVAIIEN